MTDGKRAAGHARLLDYLRRHRPDGGIAGGEFYAGSQANMRFVDAAGRVFAARPNGILARPVVALRVRQRPRPGHAYGGTRAAGGRARR